MQMLCCVWGEDCVVSNITVLIPLHIFQRFALPTCLPYLSLHMPLHPPVYPVCPCLHTTLSPHVRIPCVCTPYIYISGRLRGPHEAQQRLRGTPHPSVATAPRWVERDGGGATRTSKGIEGAARPVPVFGDGAGRPAGHCAPGPTVRLRYTLYVIRYTLYVIRYTLYAILIRRR